MPGMWQMIRTLAGRMMMIYFVTSLIKVSRIFQAIQKIEIFDF